MTESVHCIADTAYMYMYVQRALVLNHVNITVLYDLGT